MKETAGKILNAGRRQLGPYISEKDDMHGLFEIKAPTLKLYKLRVISSGPAGLIEIEDGAGEWEHVSVSVVKAKFLPGWYELQYIKRLFWKEYEVVLQFHPAEAEHTSLTEVLHLWKAPYDTPTPPTSTIALPSDQAKVEAIKNMLGREVKTRRR